MNSMQDAAEMPGDSSSTTDWTPLFLSTLSGLSTSLGASVAFCTSEKRPMSSKTLSFSLALAGSVMVTVSVVSLLPESFLDQSTHEFLSIYTFDFWKRTAAVAAGCAFYYMLNKSFPEPEAILGFDSHGSHAVGDGDDNETLKSPSTLEIVPLTSPEQSRLFKKTSLQRQTSHNSKSSLQTRETKVRIRSCKESFDENEDSSDAHYRNEDIRKTMSNSCWKTFVQGRDLNNIEARRSWRVAMLLFVSLIVHNFPEGVAVGATAMHSQHLGITTAIAIALHNIPEGVAIAVPCLAARPNAPWLAFLLASASGLAEPLGAAVAMLFLSPSNQEDSNTINGDIISMGIVLSFVAGVMVTVALMELFPESLRRSTDGKMPFFLGIVAGAVIMIGSDVYLVGAQSDRHSSDLIHSDA
ncbi:hypothetical protein MPSEU_000878600 [Mayamaea pseudoterrestris]|nr:hypothetical protein MPSEU_000878600 [Mayamaea pseudoterrestris]